MNRAERRRVAREQGWRGNKAGRQLGRITVTGEQTKTRITMAEALENADNIEKEKAEEAAAKEAAKTMLSAKHLTEMGFVLPGGPNV